MSEAPTKKTSRTGIYSKGQRRVLSIVAAAENVLIEEGYHNFSLRKVAAAAGIKLGNLQYYFPTKDELVKTMLDQVIQVYLDDLVELSESSGDDPKTLFKNVLKHVFYDLNNKKTTVFFPEVWSLSNHETHMTQYLDSMYGQYRKQLDEIILRINPRLTRAQAQRISLFICSSHEGHTMFIGYRKPWIKETGNIIDMAIQSFLWLIEKGDIPE